MSGFGLFKWIIPNQTFSKNLPLLLFFFLFYFAFPATPNFIVFLYFLYCICYFLISIFRVLVRKISYFLSTHILKTWEGFFSWFLQNLLRKFPSFVKNSGKENIHFNIIFLSFPILSVFLYLFGQMNENSIWDYIFLKILT